MSFNFQIWIYLINHFSAESLTTGWTETDMSPADWVDRDWYVTSRLGGQRLICHQQTGWKETDMSPAEISNHWLLGGKRLICHQQKYRITDYWVDRDWYVTSRNIESLTTGWTETDMSPAEISNHWLLGGQRLICHQQKYRFTDYWVDRDWYVTSRNIDSLTTGWTETDMSPAEISTQ